MRTRSTGTRSCKGGRRRGLVNEVEGRCVAAVWSAWLCYDLMMLDGLYESALPNLADSLLYPPTGDAERFPKPTARPSSSCTRALRALSVPRTCYVELGEVHRAWTGCVRACVRMVAHSFTNRIWRKLGWQI